MRFVIGQGIKLGAGMLAFGLLMISMALTAPAAGAAVPPEQDPFYSYEGSTPLTSIAPGTVLKTRTLSYHVAGVPLPVTAVQLLYRSTGETGAPTVNVTSVLEPSLRPGSPTVVSYQSFYDSLSPEADPSYAISGGVSIGGAIPTPGARSRPAGRLSWLPRTRPTSARGSSARRWAACLSIPRTTCTTSKAAPSGPA
jgi:hypothetical protein